MRDSGQSDRVVKGVHAACTLISSRSAHLNSTESWCTRDTERHKPRPKNTLGFGSALSTL